MRFPEVIRVLLIQSQDVARETTANGLLEGAGLQVTKAFSSALGLEVISNDCHDIVLLCTEVLSSEGTDVVARIHARSDRPILLLSQAGTPSLKVEALNLGADGYIDRPFEHRELDALMRAMLRRYRPGRPRRSGARARVILDSSTRTLHIDGKAVPLTRMEHEVVRLLMKRPGEVLDTDLILQAVWGETKARNVLNLRVLVSQIRRKIEADPQQPRLLRTVPWTGYLMDIAGTPEPAGSPGR